MALCGNGPPEQRFHLLLRPAHPDPAGDTDTNAAIVGGLLGALHGAESLPDHMRRQVLGWRWAKGDRHGILRPPELSPGRIPELVEQLMAGASGGSSDIAAA